MLKQLTFEDIFESENIEVPEKVEKEEVKVVFEEAEKEVVPASLLQEEELVLSGEFKAEEITPETGVLSDAEILALEKIDYC